MIIPRHLLHDHFTVQPVHPQHKQQAGQYTGAGTDRPSRRTVGCPCGHVPVRYRLHHHISHTDTDTGVGKLLENLRDGSLRHRPACLKISPEYPQDTAQKNSRRKDFERQNGALHLHQKPCAEKHK